MQTIPNDGMIRYLGLLNTERILLTSPQGIAECLQTNPYNYVKSKGIRRILLWLLGDGLVVSEGSEHKYQRKYMMTAFNFRRIKDLYPLFWHKASEFCQTLDDHVRKASKNTEVSVATVEITQWNSRASLDIICAAGFGEDSNAIQNPDSEFYRNYRLAFIPSEGAKKVRLLALLFPIWVLRRLPMQRIQDIHAAEGAVKEQIQKLLAENRRALGKSDAKEKLDMISGALRTGAFTDENLLDQSMTLFAAGHETASSSLGFAIYLLAKNPDVQRRLREEVRSRLPSPSEHATMTPEVLDSLTYLHAVCQESLRLYNPIPILHRTAVVDTTLLGMKIPKGTDIRIPSWALSKSEHLWGSTALRFRPERWLEGSKEQASKGGAESQYGFMAFSYGARSCIGAAFAKAEIAALLAAVIGRFNVELADMREDEELLVEHGVVVRIERGLNVRLTPIPGW
ncbi:hypothetical protein AAFC00_003808 [Neodothiora populina]